MKKISVVILARNEEPVIQAAAVSARLISDDVIVIDSGSTDNTAAIAEATGARVHPIVWQGFGQARNEGAGIARHDSIFCLDADEVITAELAEAVNSCRLSPGRIYGFRRRNFVGKKEIRYGEWGHDHVYRLYNRNHASWNLDKVHETIVGTHVSREKIGGSILHFTTDNLDEYQRKLDQYARLSADKFLLAGKKPSGIKRFLSPVFSFVKNYLFRFGFLDGITGLHIALLHAGYTYKKYAYLVALHRRTG